MKVMSNVGLGAAGIALSVSLLTSKTSDNGDIDTFGSTLGTNAQVGRKRIWYVTVG